MLFTKPLEQLTADDIRRFAARFRENIRVEYKSTFDQSVRRKLPAIVASFANTYGGVLVIGIRAEGGVPERDPRGIALDDHEPRLTVENICRENIYPELMPEVAVIPGDDVDHAFLIVSVDESPFAPHAIENSRKVYVRTGDSQNPYDLADLEMLSRLLRRREGIRARWLEFVSESEALAQKIGHVTLTPFVDLTVGPAHAAHKLASREEIYALLRQVHLDPRYQLHRGIVLRHPAGAFVSRPEPEGTFVNLGEYGLTFWRHVLSDWDPGRIDGFGNRVPSGGQLYPFWWLVAPVYRALLLTCEFTRAIHFLGQLQIRAQLVNCSNKAFTLATENRSPLEVTPVVTVVDLVPALAYAESDDLPSSVPELCAELLYQLRWPFGAERAHAVDEVQSIVASYLQKLGARF